MKKLKPILLLLAGLFMSIFGYAQESTEESTEDFAITKGRYYGALTFSSTSRNAENENQILRQVINQDRFNYRIVGNGGYAIKDNLTLGMSLGYGRSREDITVLDENNEEVTTNSLRQGLSVAPNMRNYIPIGSGQLQILVQTSVEVTRGESLRRITRAQEIEKIEGDFIDVELGVSPGMILFFNRNWAFETTVGIAGFSTRIEEEVVNNDQDNRQRIVETAVDLRLNLLNLNLGVAFYF